MNELAQAARIAALKEQLRQERELDQQIAALLGWHSFTPGLHGGMLLGLKAEEPAAPGVTSRHEEVPWYSTDMGDAWLVVERMPFHVEMRRIYRSKRYSCKMYPDGREPVEAEAGTMPEAICRCALLAVSDP